MKIADVLCSAGYSGFYFDDQKAIKSNARQDGFVYLGKPATPGFRSPRQAGECVSILLLLEDGQIAVGDCAAIQYSGAGGRDPVFLAADFVPYLRNEIAPMLRGRTIAGFLDWAKELDSLEHNGRRIHAALRYGLTQAALDAVAKSQKKLMCEVLAQEYRLSLPTQTVSIFCQSGDDRRSNVDKMILKQADVMPHGLINNIPEKLGKNGELLLSYIEWLAGRVVKLRPLPTYTPVLHIDVYGTIGVAFDHDLDHITRYFGQLEKAARPFRLRIEGPVDMGERRLQCRTLADLRKRLQDSGINVQIVADEWCNSLEDIELFCAERAVDMIQIKTPVLGGINNSIESVLHCKQAGIGSYLGGTCNETDVSARVCVHVALVTRPDQMLAKPGMGVDEGFMIVHNEMQRSLALLAAKGYPQ